MKDYFIYLIIDPRSLKETFYGIGCGEVNAATLGKDELMALNIDQVLSMVQEDIEPLIKVVAKNLSKDEATAMQAAFMWKLDSDFESNIDLRDSNSMHKQLAGWDFSSRIHVWNLQESPQRSWKDFEKYGFLSGGQGARYKKEMMQLRDKDYVVIQIPTHGYVGIGRVKGGVTAYDNFKVKGTPISDMKLTAKCPEANRHSIDLSEYFIPVEWDKTFTKAEAKTDQRMKNIRAGKTRTVIAKNSKEIKALKSMFDMEL